MLSHYYLEDKTSQLYPHKAPVTSLTWDIDTATGFIWCNYSRPLTPRTMWELDLGMYLYQFYFIGIKNESGWVWVKTTLHPPPPPFPLCLELFLRSIFFS